MEGLVVAAALVVGTALATGISLAGLRLIMSFVPGPNDGDAEAGEPSRGAA